jgi:hypothetical protein
MQNGFRFSIRNDDKEQLYLTVNKEKKTTVNWAQATLLPTRWKSTFWGWEFAV